MKPAKIPEKGGKWFKQSERGGEESKRKRNLRLLCYFKPRFCFLCIAELRKLISCIWIRRPQKPDSDQKTARLAKEREPGNEVVDVSAKSANGSYLLSPQFSE